MINEKYSCNLTVEEIHALIRNCGNSLTGVYLSDEAAEHINYTVERLVYLNKRLKDIEAKKIEETKPAAVAGWGTPKKE